MTLQASFVMIPTIPDGPPFRLIAFWVGAVAVAMTTAAPFTSREERHFGHVVDYFISSTFPEKPHISSRNARLSRDTDAATILSIRSTKITPRPLPFGHRLRTNRRRISTTRAPNLVINPGPLPVVSPSTEDNDVSAGTPIIRAYSRPPYVFITRMKLSSTSVRSDEPDTTFPSVQRSPFRITEVSPSALPQTALPREFAHSKPKESITVDKFSPFHTETINYGKVRIVSKDSSRIETETKNSFLESESAAGILTLPTPIRKPVPLRVSSISPSQIQRVSVVSWKSSTSVVEETTQQPQTTTQQTQSTTQQPRTSVVPPVTYDSNEIQVSRVSTTTEPSTTEVVKELPKQEELSSPKIVKVTTSRVGVTASTFKTDLDVSDSSTRVLNNHHPSFVENFSIESSDETEAIVTEIAKNDTEISATSKSSITTNIYIIGIIGIIPLAGVITWFVRKFMKRKFPPCKSSCGTTRLVVRENHIYRNQQKLSSALSLSLHSDETLSRPSPNNSWEIPRRQLKLLNLIGEGNFGQVWKAEASNLCKGGKGPLTVAAKTVKENATEKEKQDLLRELAILQHLDIHPNVVSLLGCCTKRDPVYVVMEYVKYGKLLRYLRDHRSIHSYRNSIGEKDVLTSHNLTKFAYDVSSGMQYLSSQGVIHRDLAARNILVGQNKCCKICDFGLSRRVTGSNGEIYEQKTKGAMPIRWMAPEALYLNIFTMKTDVWAFGILLWEIVTMGSTPYPGMTAYQVVKRISDGYRMEKPEHCRPELYTIMSQCWQMDATKRPTFTDLRHHLERLLANQTGYIDLDGFAGFHYYNFAPSSNERV